MRWMPSTPEGFRQETPNSSVRFEWLPMSQIARQGLHRDAPMQDIIKSGGVGEWLKPAVLKN
jgi:hypothetical protein